MGRHSPHAVTVFGVDRNVVKIKNSYFNRKLIEIDLNLETYGEFRNDMDGFRRRNRPNGFTDNDCVLYEFGYGLEFRDISKIFQKNIRFLCRSII